jgi:hypothetical protein
VVITDRSRRARFAFVADQSDHSPDPKPNLTSDAAYAEPLGPQGHRCFHFLGLALLYSTPPKLLPFGTRTSNPAITRSRIIARSNSANTPSIWNMARPDGVDVSRPC